MVPNAQTPQSVINLQAVKAKIESAERQALGAQGGVHLVAVSKTFEADDIRPVLQAGHRIFGENRVQEAKGKWAELQASYEGVELHLIGPLQSNKVGEAVALFDVIQTIDRPKIARAISREIEKQQKPLKLFVQVNTGNEPQKAGIQPDQITDFLALCQDECGLNIIGLMCIPPFDEDPEPHFKLLKQLADDHDLKEVSMGMSADYEKAAQLGATFVRVGSGIFGARSQ